MNMKQSRTLLRRGLFAGLIIVGLTLPVRSMASELPFPYYADTWPQIQAFRIFDSFFKQGEKKEDKEEKKEQEAQEVVDKEKLTRKDREVLYKVVSMECDTGYEGSLAVISCMLNRQASKKYPDDLMEVVREDSQFTAYYDKETDTYPYVDREPSKECIAAVNDALEKGKRNIPSYIYYFRSSDYEYLKGYITYGQIGDNTYFYQYEDL